MKLPWIGMQLKEEIGSGSYGTVYRVSLDDTVYALKVIRIPQENIETELLAKTLGSIENAKEYFQGIANEYLKEIHILQLFQKNPNIVKIEDYRVRGPDPLWCIGTDH